MMLNDLSMQNAGDILNFLLHHRLLSGFSSQASTTKRSRRGARPPGVGAWAGVTGPSSLGSCVSWDLRLLFMIYIYIYTSILYIYILCIFTKRILMLNDVDVRSNCMKSTYIVDTVVFHHILLPWHEIWRNPQRSRHVIQSIEIPQLATCPLHIVFVSFVFVLSVGGQNSAATAPLTCGRTSQRPPQKRFGISPSGQGAGYVRIIKLLFVSKDIECTRQSYQYRDISEYTLQWCKKKRQYICRMMCSIDPIADVFLCRHLGCLTIRSLVVPVVALVRKSHVQVLKPTSITNS